VACALFTSQPGVSRQIRELEDELGVVIFERNGKRLTGLTEPGKGILQIIERLLVEAGNLQQASHEYAAPDHIAEWVLSGKADIGIATEGLSQFPGLVSFPCYRWSHLIVAPDGHPLLANSPIRLEDLADWPLITYDVGFTGRGHIDAAFAKAGVDTDIVLTAMDSDVIKQYVSLGLGVGIVASMAFDHGRDKGLRAVEASHLFAPNVTRLAVRRGAYLRSYAYHFISQFAPGLTRADIDAAMQTEIAA
jgi:LysR family cys regulon transcriptional activator